MESALLYIAGALMMGLGAWVRPSVLVFSVGVFLKVQHVSQS